MTDASKIDRLIQQLKAAIGPSTSDRSNYGFAVSVSQDNLRVLLAECDRLAAENARLRKALEPFAKEAIAQELRNPQASYELPTWGEFTIAQVRRARAALENRDE